MDTAEFRAVLAQAGPVEALALIWARVAPPVDPWWEADRLVQVTSSWHRSETMPLPVIAVYAAA